MILIYSCIFFLGASLGSFCYTYYLRREAEISIVQGRSYCDHCGHKIDAQYLIPVISYLLLQGKCPYCHKKISVYTCFFELFYGMISIVCFLLWGWTICFWIRLLQISLLLLLAYTDSKTMMIYRWDVILIGGLQICYRLWEKENVLFSLWCAMILGSAFWILMVVTKAMGQGDVEFSLACGLFAENYYELFNIFRNSFLFASIFSVFLILCKKKSRKDELAFGPFMALAILVHLLWRY